jgi:hypothetical protein
VDTPILALQLAREIELAEAQAAVGCVETMKKLAPETSSGFQRIWRKHASGVSPARRANRTPAHAASQGGTLAH